MAGKKIKNIAIGDKISIVELTVTRLSIKKHGNKVGMIA